MRDESTSMRRQSRIKANIETGAWASFFIWVGVSLLADLGWGIGLLGAALITFTAQLARRQAGLPVEGFWLFVGVVFALGGIWSLLSGRPPGLPDGPPQIRTCGTPASGSSDHRFAIRSCGSARPVGHAVAGIAAAGG